ncbi:MAG TPA: hypothetical protein VFU86_13690, partial [Terriglobales bacterium]|nr:hypothetical protein [Terriglobales bacterium]
MKSALFTVTVAALLVLPAAAQMRSTISAGPIHTAGPFSPVRPHPPGIVFRPGFGHHFRGNRFGTIVYPYGFYDGFYDGYPEAVEQPAPPVVIVHDEAPAASAVTAPVVPAEPRMIAVPEQVSAPTN